MSIPYAEIIGEPVAHSKSPSIHRYWLESLGIEARYGAETISRNGLGEYLRERRRDALWKGCNITLPHKVAALDHLTQLSPDARSIGAVNCVVHQGEGELLGLNTDAHAVLFALTPAFVAGRATILGAGGAARAALFALSLLAIDEIVIAARDMRRARDMLDSMEVDGRVQPFDVAPSGDLVINATPLGMTGQPPLAIDLTGLSPAATVFDMVYAPVETRLLFDARARGLRSIDGLTMLIEQAAMSFAAFFNAGPDVADTPELRGRLS